MNEQIQPITGPNEAAGQQLPTTDTMAEMTGASSPDDLQLVRLPAGALVSAPEELDESQQDTAEELESAYEGWLERRGIDPTRTPRLTMGEREYDLFRNAPSDYLDYSRRLYGIPQDDQDNCQYVLVDKKFDDTSKPPEPKLMIVNDVDFGTTIDPDRIAKDFRDDSSDPDDPTESPGNTYVTVDIADTLVDTRREVTTFAQELMKGQTVDPFSNPYGDLGIRAGDLFPGQKDAYVWTTSPITKSVELTVAFPNQYDSVCVVSGQQREAANGKAGMAQIDDPTVILKIEGEALENLKDTYRRLYHNPDFALTEQQKNERDILFNDHVIREISRAARENQAREDYEHQLRYTQQPQLRARGLPRS